MDNIKLLCNEILAYFYRMRENENEERLFITDIYFRFCMDEYKQESVDQALAELIKIGLIEKNGDFYRSLKPEEIVILECEEKVSLKEKLKFLRKMVSFSIYTVKENYCLHLFDLFVDANNEVDCIWEDTDIDLDKVIDRAIEWCKEYLDSKKWHKRNQHKMVEIDSEDWKLAEKYKKQHSTYSGENVLIEEVWRDKNNTLCVRYIDSFGRELDWYHYLENDNELEWW